MKHKHADLIKAWADGAEIEYLSPVTDCWQEISDPTWCLNIDYRIKPEPKPDVVMYAIASMNEVDIGRRSVDPDDWASVLTNLETSDDNLKLTFDGATGKLKYAEVLK